MTYGAALVSVICLAVAFRKFGIVSVAGKAMQSVREAVGVMRNAVMPDSAKEQAARASSQVLMWCFCSIALRAAAALGVSLLPLLILDIAGVVRLSAVNQLLTSWNGLVLACAGMALAHVMTSRRERTE